MATRNTTSTFKKEPSKAKLPPEFLRKVVQDHKSLATATSKTNAFKTDDRYFIAAMRFVPHAMLKVFECMPMPWEETRHVDVIYHERGALTVIDETRHVCEPLYVGRWAATWIAMRKHKRAQKENFQRVTAPYFPNDEEPIDFATHIMDAQPMDAIRLSLEGDSDYANIAAWLFSDDQQEVLRVLAGGGSLKSLVVHLHSRARDQTRGGSKWKLSLPVMADLHRLSSILFSDYVDRNYFFLFEDKSFYTAKALNVAIPGGPKYEPLHEENANSTDHDWTQFNDLSKIIYRHRKTTEQLIAFPFLHSQEVRGAVLSPYHYSPEVYIRCDDPDVPAFFVDPAFNPVKTVKKCPELVKQERELFSAKFDNGDDEFDSLPPLISLDGDDDAAAATIVDTLDLPEDFGPMFANDPLEVPSETKEGIKVLWGEGPFTRTEGNTKRAVDVKLFVNSWYREHYPIEAAPKVRKSAQRMLKKDVKEHLHESRPSCQNHHTGSSVSTIDELRKVKYFKRTRVDWLEAALQLVRQCHTMMALVLRRKNLPYVHLDYNFNLWPTKTLTTKERKKSRVGQAFHLLREMMMFMKYTVDAHVMFRMGRINAYQLADTLHHLFTHTNTLTGMYKYKYRVMRQARQCKDLKHLIYARFNTGEVEKGPGSGFWGPSWRVWFFFLRGILPFLEKRCLANMIMRLYKGRAYKMKAKKVTKQRLDSDYDINLKNALRQTVAEYLPANVRGDAEKKIEQHCSEAWRCWKRNVPWKVPGLPEVVEKIVLRYVKLSADNYEQHTRRVRNRICRGDTIDKNVFKKNLGRMTRLKLRAEQQRQLDYLHNGPAIRPDTGKSILLLMSQWLEFRNFKQIDFPKMNHPRELDLLKLTLDHLRQQHNIGNRLTQAEREEQAIIERAFDNPQDTLARIRKILSTQRTFSAINVDYIDDYHSLAPIYEITTPWEKIADAYLDQYMWYEACSHAKRELFPNWVKPNDLEPTPVLLQKWCNGINQSPGVWDVEGGEMVAMVQLRLDTLYDSVDWGLMRQLLKLIMHEELAAYIDTRHNTKLKYKDMEHLNRIGLIRGFKFAGFLAQFWGLAIDLMLLGSKRAQQIAGRPEEPNPFLRFHQRAHATNHPIRGYSRHFDQVHIFVKYTKDEARELIDRYLEHNEETSFEGFPNKKCWPRDCRMRLYRNDVNFARALLWDFEDRLPKSVADVSEASKFVSVYSRDNPNLLFDMCGFEFRLLPVSRTLHEPIESESMWALRKEDETKELSCRAYLQVSEEHVTIIRNKVRRTLMSVGNATFQKIADKWNMFLRDVVPYYREAILGTEGLQEIFVKGEMKMQRRIMMALNSKMPARFPPVVFHSPPEVGGLGMLSIAGALIPAKDRSVSRQTETGVQYFIKGIVHEGNDQPIPVLFRYFPSWASEFRESDAAWALFHQLREEAVLAKRRYPSFDEVEDIIDLGIPRIRTLYSKDTRRVVPDRGFRVRAEFQRYIFGKPPRSTWYNEAHDGRLVGFLDQYKKDMIMALGGIEAIMEHTLFKGTGLPSWEGLFFNAEGTFEEKKKHAKLTKAQRGGLVKPTNRRFALWWSPTLNRSNVYAGFETQLDLCGIKMRGKLELLKQAYIGLLHGHLWEKIHAGVAMDLLKGMTKPDVQVELDVQNGQRQVTHLNKCTTYTNSCADVVLTSASQWLISRPSVLNQDEANDKYKKQTTRTYWIDVQLRWGDYDDHNVAQWAKDRYYAYTNDGVSRYPDSSAGVIVAIDLAYNCYSAYGQWFKGGKKMVTLIMNAIMRNAPTLQTIRERMRTQLQIFTSDPTEKHLCSENFEELFSERITWIVDDSQLKRKSSITTAEGNRKATDENRGLVVVNPKDGSLYLSIIHKSTFKGHSRRTRLEIEKCCEAIETWLRQLPVEERPNQIIVLNKALAATLNHTLLSFPNIVITKSDLSMPLGMILWHDRLAEMVATATASRGLKMKLFDDWDTLLQPATCFKRLMLILRGLRVDPARAWQILHPDDHFSRQPSNFWPTLPPSEWIAVEKQFKNMILHDYARRNMISPDSLTKMEQEHVILGQRVASIEIQKEEIEKIEGQQKQLTGPTVVTKMSKTGEVITTTVHAAFNTEALTIAGASGGTATSEWQKRAVEASKLNERLRSQLTIDDTANAATASVLTFPVAILRRFLLSVEPKSSSVGLLFGKFAPTDKKIAEVRCIYMPPQACKEFYAMTPPRIAPHETLQGLDFLGFMRSQPQHSTLNTTDLSNAGRWLSEQENVSNGVVTSLSNVTTVVAGFGPLNCRLKGYTLTDEGLKWGQEHAAELEHPRAVHDSHTTPCLLKVSNKIQGFFLVPANDFGQWNKIFSRLHWTPEEDYEMKVDVPIDFFNLAHRKLHVESFARAVGETAAIDIAEMEDEIDM